MKTVHSAVRVVTMWLPRALAVTLITLEVCSGVLECELKKNRLATHYSLSDTARASINYKDGQGVSGFWALECTCDPYDVRKGMQSPLP